MVDKWNSWRLGKVWKTKKDLRWEGPRPGEKCSEEPKNHCKLAAKMSSYTGLTVHRMTIQYTLFIHFFLHIFYPIFPLFSSLGCHLYPIYFNSPCSLRYTAYDPRPSAVQVDLMIQRTTRLLQVASTPIATVILLHVPIFPAEYLPPPPLKMRANYGPREPAKLVLGRPENWGPEWTFWPPNVPEVMFGEKWVKPL